MAPRESQTTNPLDAARVYQRITNEPDRQNMKSFRVGKNSASAVQEIVGRLDTFK